MGPRLSSRISVRPLQLIELCGFASVGLELASFSGRGTCRSNGSAGRSASTAKGRPNARFGSMLGVDRPCLGSAFRRIGSGESRVHN